jgi:hypothetical protein
MAMMRKLLLVSLPVLALACGCGEPPKPPPPEPPPKKQWQIEMEHLQSVIKVGMTEAEVLKAAGEPQRVRSVVGMVRRVIWEYSLPSEKSFIVRFDDKGKVAGCELVSAVKVNR